MSTVLNLQEGFNLYPLGTILILTTPNHNTHHITSLLPDDFLVFTLLGTTVQLQVQANIQSVNQIAAYSNASYRYKWRATVNVHIKHPNEEKCDLWDFDHGMAAG